MFIVVASHPIQYQVPVWQELGRKLGDEFLVIFLCKQGVTEGEDTEFGREVFWDFELLDGYKSEFIYDCQDKVVSFWQNRIKNYWMFGKRLSQLKPKTVLIGGWNLLGYVQTAIIARIFFNAEIWLRCEANNFKEANFWRSLFKRGLISSLLKICSKFFYIGRANKQFYESFGIRSSQLYFAGYGVDNTKFASSEHSSIRAEFRRKFGLFEDSKVVLFSGKFIEKKRPMDLILAVEKIAFQARGVPIQILFVGSGALMADLKSKSDEVMSTFPDIGRDKVIFTGFLNQGEIIAAYQAADLLVLPSDAHETWGLVVNEALATDLPVAVSSSCGCAYDLVERHFPGMVFEEGDLDAISRVISEGVFICRDNVRNFHPVANYSSCKTARAFLDAYA